MCCDAHSEKMCSVTCCPCHIDIEKVKSRSDNPAYICKACGRVANSAEHLCEPESIK